MKKLISILLCTCMLVGLAACASGEGAEATEPQKSFRVGYSKVNITPSQPAQLWGYAGRERLHQNVLDYIYLTCVALADENDNTILMYSVDTGSADKQTAQALKTLVNKETGVPEEHIFFTATHTHSAPYFTKMGTQLSNAAVQSAQEAIADLKPAEMYYGAANTVGISFVRSYYAEDGTVVGVNFGDRTKTLVGHTTEIDDEMRILQFKREGGKDVIMANWQCHPHRTGGPEIYDLSADIIGMMRTNMEQDLDCLFVYYQGGAGNIDPISYIQSEEVNIGREYKEHGRLMAMTAKKALENMTKINTGEIKVMTQTQTYNSNKLDLDKIPVAQMVIDYYNEGHTHTEAKAYAESLDPALQSYFNAVNIVGRARYPDTYDITISAVAIGDLGWGIFPGECFDATLRDVRNESPFEYNFTSAYTNDYIGYFPTEVAWDLDGYEVGATRVERGVAEDMGSRVLDMLNTLHGE